MKQLKDILDKASFDLLVKNFGGKRIWVPKEGNIGHHNPDYFKQRNREICKYYKTCKDITKSARKFGLSEKTIYSVVGNY